ncbi:hypothetical protein [Haladaptatus sp. NG-SE-30]
MGVWFVALWNTCYDHAIWKVALANGFREGIFDGVSVVGTMLKVGAVARMRGVWDTGSTF